MPLKIPNKHWKLLAKEELKSKNTQTIERKDYVNFLNAITLFMCTYQHRNVVIAVIVQAFQDVITVVAL